MHTPPASPITLATHRHWRFATLCILYFAQGVPYGFVTVALLGMLSKRGATTEQTGGLVALSVLPWTFKIFWGPIIDSYRLPSFGRRRPWIVLAQFMMAATLLIGVSAADITSDSTMALLGAVIFVHNCFNSLQDVATDALAVDLLSDKERGRVNAFMWASKLLGVAAGGAGIGTLMAYTNLQTGMRAQGALLLLIMLLPLLLRERPGERLFPWSRDSHAHVRSNVIKTGPVRVVKELWRAFGLRATSLGLVLAFFTLIGEGLSVPMNADLFTNRLGWSPEKFAQMHDLFGTIIGSLVGAIGGGLLCDRFGARRFAAVGAAIVASTFLAFALTSAWWSHEYYPSGLYFFMLKAGLAMTTVSLFSLYMSMAWTTAAATQFTLYMTVLNLGNAFGATLTRAGLGHEASFVLCGGVSAMPLLILPFIKPHTVLARKREADVRATGLPQGAVIMDDQPTATAAAK